MLVLKLTENNYSFCNISTADDNSIDYIDYPFSNMKCHNSNDKFIHILNKISTTNKLDYLEIAYQLKC